MGFIEDGTGSLSPREQYEQLGEIPSYYGLLHLGSDQVQFDPNAPFFEHFTPEQLSSPLSVACTHLILQRLQGLFPAGLPTRDIPRRLEYAAQYADQAVGALNGLAIRNYEGISYTEYTDPATKGLLAEALIYYSALANRIPLRFSSIDEDRKGIDFVLTTSDGEFNFDVTAIASRKELQRKLENTDSTLLYLPIGGSQVILGSAIQGEVGTIATRLGRPNTEVTIDKICRGEVGHVLDISNFTWVMRRAAAASQGVYQSFEYSMDHDKFKEANTALQMLRSMTPDERYYR